MKKASYKFKVDHKMDGQRIDLAVMAHPEFELSRRKLRRILDVGGVYINKKRVRVASRTVSVGDIVEVEYNPTNLETEFRKKFTIKDMPVLFEDDVVVAFNKPPGLPSQATRDQSVLHAEALAQQYFLAKGDTKTKPILVHRLDKETSGVLLFAKDAATSAFITDQFKQRTIGKKYLALVFGTPKDYEFTVKCHLSPIDKRTGVVRKVRSGGQKSETEFVLCGSNIEQNISLVECYPKTGRSHQIRVHLEHKGHPIIGDKKYGRQLQRMHSKAVEAALQEHHMLHAEELCFKTVPKSDSITVRAEAPRFFKKICDLLSL